MMGGDIFAESKYGYGTTFTVTIPVVIGNEENLQFNESDEDTLTISAPDAKILVTDDNEFNLRVTSGLLSLMEINTETANSGFKAIDLIQENDYDIVFMDHMMPEMDGIETVHKIRALGGKYEKLKIIALTANAIKGAREMFIDNSFDDFLSKPIDISEMREIIKRYLPHDKLKITVSKENIKTSNAIEDEIRSKSIATFVKENRNAFMEMTKALSSQDIKTAHRIAHTIKSAAGYLDKKKLQEAAGSLEESFKDGIANHTPQQLRIFQNELSAALFEYETRLKNSEEEKQETVTITESEKSTLLDELEPLLKRDDFGAAKYVDKLQSISGMEELAEMIDEYDFAGALAILEKMKSE